MISLNIMSRTYIVACPENCRPFSDLPHVCIKEKHEIMSKYSVFALGIGFLLPIGCDLVRIHNELIFLFIRWHFKNVVFTLPFGRFVDVLFGWNKFPEKRTEAYKMSWEGIFRLSIWDFNISKVVLSSVHIIPSFLFFILMLAGVMNIYTFRWGGIMSSDVSKININWKIKKLKKAFSLSNCKFLWVCSE